MLVFETKISRIESIGGGWVGGEPKAGQRTNLDSKSSAVSSVSDMN